MSSAASTFPGARVVGVVRYDRVRAGLLAHFRNEWGRLPDLVKIGNAVHYLRRLRDSSEMQRDWAPVLGTWFQRDWCDRLLAEFQPILDQHLEAACKRHDSNSEVK